MEVVRKGKREEGDILACWTAGLAKIDCAVRRKEKGARWEEVDWRHRVVRTKCRTTGRA